MHLNSRGFALGGLLLCAALLATACNAGNGRSPLAPTPLAEAGAPVGSGNGSNIPPANNPVPSGPPPIVGSGTATMIAAGDVGVCGSRAMGQVARLIDGLAGDLLLPGDLAYPRGTTDDFRRCFDPDFGRFRSRWRPAPGNHEYETPGASAYFDYFGDAAGPRGVGYYAFRAATWHVLMLNSNVPMTRGSAQWQWADRELRNNRTRCTMAVWHHPFSSSGPNGPNGQVRDLWDLLHENGAEFVVSGHDHLYERFAPQDRDYRYSPDGVRQFVVGTGGQSPYRAVTRAPNTEALFEVNGVLQVTLEPSGYAWDFIDAPSGRSLDRGSAACH